MNKSLATNLLSLLCIGIGYTIPIYSEQFKIMGFFAFSGAITNWIAIHMLFEKVPFLYGSGVIAMRFEDFKLGIKKLIMEQFFTEENISKFLQSQNSAEPLLDKDKVIGLINFDTIFNDLVEVIMSSSFGGMLGMFGGVEALTPLKEPFKQKMETSIHEIIHSPEFSEALSFAGQGIGSSINTKVGTIVDQRLDELTPQMVKEIIQDMIRKHLGWLVVWGGIFGGLIGLVTTFIL